MSKRIKIERIEDESIESLINQLQESQGPGDRLIMIGQESNGLPDKESIPVELLNSMRKIKEQHDREMDAKMMADEYKAITGQAIPQGYQVPTGVVDNYYMFDFE